MLNRDLVQTLRRKRPQLDFDDVILHYDNGPAHRAHDTELDIVLLGFDLLPHPPYSPDIAPMDFRLFPGPKNELRGQRFETPIEFRNKVREIISSFSQDWFKTTFDQLDTQTQEVCGHGWWLRRESSPHSEIWHLDDINFDVGVRQVLLGVIVQCSM